jgi:UDP-glucuronate 4-epimerase
VAALEVDAPWTLVNLGSGNPVTLEEMIVQLEAALGKEAKREMLPAHPGDLFGTWADVSAAERELGFRAEWSFEQGVRRFAEWFTQEAELAGDARPSG